MFERALRAMAELGAAVILISSSDNDPDSSSDELESSTTESPPPLKKFKSEFVEILTDSDIEQER